MNKHWLGLLFALGAAAPAAAMAQNVQGAVDAARAGATLPDRADTAAADGDATRELVVDFRDDASDEFVRDVGRAVGVEFAPNSVEARVDRIMLARVPATREAELLARLRQTAGVQAAEENFEMHADIVPNDPQLGDQWGMARVGAPAAWDVTCGRGVTVAVIDTGVACENHGEFTRVMDLGGTRCLPGYDFVSDGEHANDDQGHGTHVAGTIAQTTNNGFGVAGLAYCATILPVKVLNANGSGSLADVADGIRYAVDHGAQVLNLSLGGGRHNGVMAEAVAYARGKGAVVVTAAGNNGRYVESPASEPGSFAVSAIDPGDEIAYFSSRGPEIQIAAPGVNILQQTICEHGRNRCEQFASWSGTSMATPHVAAAAALLFSVGVTNGAAVESILRASASAPQHGGRDANLFGAGVLDAHAAVNMAVQRQALVRGLALALLAVILVVQIRRGKGQVAALHTWAPLALLTGVGLFFLPALVPHTTPGVDLAMRPLGDWTLLAGTSVHQWLPLANALVVLGLVGLGFSRKAWRAPIGGFALGTCAYILAAMVMGYHAAPLGSVLQFAWFALNAVACFWVARIALDTRTVPDGASA